MRFKQYAGRSVAELAPRIREELGPDAVILKQRPVRTGGVGGFFARTGVEVLAADAQPPDTEAALREAVGGQAPHVDTADAPQESTEELLRETFSQALEARVAREATAGAPAAEVAPVAVAPAPLQPLAEPETVTTPPTGAYAPPNVRRFEPVRIDATAARGGLRLAAAPALAPQDVPLGDEADDLVLELDRAGVPRAAAAELVREVQLHVAPFATDGGLRELVRGRMAARIRTEQGWADGHGTRRIAIVGDAGVGKTSAVARLAAAYAQAGLSVGVLVLTAPAGDEHPLLPRLGATVGSEADRALAYMAGADILRAETPLEVRRAVKRFADRDVLLVDTPPLKSAEATLREQLEALAPQELHAVVPLALSEREADAAVARMARLGANRVLVSKTDEARFAGPLYGLASRRRPAALLPRRRGARARRPRPRGRGIDRPAHPADLAPDDGRLHESPARWLDLGAAGDRGHRRAVPRGRRADRVRRRRLRDARRRRRALGLRHPRPARRGARDAPRLVPRALHRARVDPRQRDRPAPGLRGPGRGREAPGARCGSRRPACRSRRRSSRRSATSSRRDGARSPRT